MPAKRNASTQVNAAKPQPAKDSLKNAPAPPSSQPKSNSVALSTRPTETQSFADKDDEDSKTGDTTESAGEPTPAPAVNRKKQKRREKEAARRAEYHIHPNGDEHASPKLNGQLPPVKQGRGPVKGYFTEEPDYPDPSDPSYADLGSPEEAFYSGDEDPQYAEGADTMPDSSWLNTSKRKKSKSGRSHLPENDSLSRSSTMLSRSHIPTLSNAAMRASHKLSSSDHIWNTSTQAERENIKQFWLELGEEERRSLVKVEKEAVLRKMKEQQKHSCSCSVCGRKRTAIEEELEVLYDAYYEELEQFANHNTDLPNVPPMMAPPRPSFKRVAHPMAGSYPSRGRVHEVDDEDEDLEDEDEYDDEDEEAYSDEDDYDDHGLPPGPPDFFQFGNSLTVKGLDGTPFENWLQRLTLSTDGILTVADDLLKNDGKHFIDMMEQLAERRMQREEEIRYPSSAYAHQGYHQGHNHPPIDDDDDYDDDEDDEDYDSQEEDDFEGDEMDSMTEEQRMEEGRRMFQIFAARMFEQRVLTAYREKVAAERQRKLLEELDEETRLDGQREAKKAREAAKKKEKKRLQKQAKDEEKAKREAEKAAQEAAARELEEKRQEEQRKRRDEQRKKREAEKKAAEEERLRKEAEKHRKQQEQRERQAETERKQREAKERERLKRDEAKKKEREEREAKERKAKEEQEKKVKDEQARREREVAQKVEKDTKPHLPTMKQQPVALPPGLHPPSRGSSMQSPHFQVATPAVPPKVPTPARNRQPSQPSQHSHGSSPKSQKASTDISGSSGSPATVAMPQTPAPGQPAKVHGQPPVLHHPQPSAPRSPLNNLGRGQYPFNMNGLPSMGLNGPPMGGQGMMPNMMPPMPMYQGPPPMGNHQRFAMNGMQYPPGIPRPFQPVQQMPFVPQSLGQAAPMVSQQPVSKPSGHSRQPSTEASSQPTPISRPGPIARPSSTTPDKQKPMRKSPDAEVEQLTTQLGSKALLDDSDAPFLETTDSRMNLPPVGPPGSTRLPFASSFPEHKQEPFAPLNHGWGGFHSGMSPTPSWGPPGPQRPSPGWSQPPFGAIGGGPQTVPRSHFPRPIAVRLMLVQACRQLSQIPGASADGYHPAQTVLRQLETLKAPGEPPVSMDEMLGICDTEGNPQNGGGSFEVVIDKARGQVIKFVDEGPTPQRGSVGEIGSPVMAHSQHIQTSPFGGIGASSFGPPGRSF
ncbi:Stress response protein nst1 [Exophiala xenobiotica]|uniref:Stress response protein NST1 n=1 Tax=Vermiconidia calcicola TaxID=1690605 RepID=A0AAV9PZ93_9PEZI|nr:Stress response protein nst1 [Exophiala xenobiotica]KAK5532000.1 Stress response protein nst1 [Vermiconidia calcicola]KAK5539476.1 Stress response protein nst1 [Chaetothyriales sp. CCFEE 6169]KAK5221177.1 Stress response protein nst1 [Exophiala xenobiotica]KAK5229231.1 Stress response protein nst1 [Exophiala xenobiotica]